MTSSVMRTVILLRHTQTTWNAESRYQGRIDTPLSAQGKADVIRIASLVQPGDFEVAFSSPLTRARVLAQDVCSAARCSLSIDERLTEISMGPWEGITRREIEEHFPALLETWETRSDEVRFPNGESLEDVASRARSLMNEVFDAHSSPILIVSHDAVIKVIIMLALGLELRHLHRFRMRNGSISILHGSHYVGSVETIDSVAHLRSSPFRIDR
jgi:broad specificity phosphatase PhoE